jgi:hypothetical protein
MTLNLLVVAASAALVVSWFHRCEFGLHPRAGRMMRPGRRTRDGHVAAAWECGRCRRVVGETRLVLNPRTLRQLRSQVGAARARSKVIELYVVRKADGEVA